MLVFFDFDGTLSAPRFPKPGVPGACICGLSAESWRQYHEGKREHTFDFCLPVGPVRRFAMRLKEEGHRLFVLTRTASESENLGKKAFLTRWYPGLFEEYLSVEHDREKIPVMRRKAEENGVKEEQLVLVEDTYSLVLEALSQGMTGIHVSNIVAEEDMQQGGDVMKVFFG
ncbi:MAG: hypothetical protein Q4B85_02960 [Lachnospiraceae bacterium]|nr:hypothetical protein [Lachnospiraceae bacterium]